MGSSALRRRKDLRRRDDLQGPRWASQAKTTQVGPAEVSNLVADALTRKPLLYDLEDDRPLRLADLYRSRRDMFWDGSRTRLSELTYGHYRGHLQGQHDLAVYP